jgi:hypothetical protein
VAVFLPPLNQRPEEMHMLGMQYVYQKFHGSYASFTANATRPEPLFCDR